MKRTIAVAALVLSLVPTAAMAQERVGDAALGALSGALVLGPVGAVAGAVIGYSAGPSISRSLGVRRTAPARQARGSAQRATPVEIGHVVLFVKDLEASSRFYRERLGFWLSDQYPGRGHFLRCSGHGGHHNLFLLQTPEGRAGLNHVAFTVRDLHEVIGGGLNMSRRGWETELGPGRHPISSAMFWYFQSPAGALVEYYTDEDELTPAWQPRDFTPGPTVFAEWAIKGGIDGQTRRQKHAEAPSGRFMTDTKK